MSALNQIITGGLILAICTVGAYYGGHRFVSGIKNWNKPPEVIETSEENNVSKKLPLFASGELRDAPQSGGSNNVVAHLSCKTIGFDK